MARYTGPVTRKSRRLKVDLVGGDQAFERRPYPPGQHGRGRVKESEYLLQLQEKQKARFTYGVLERQFRGYYDEAARRQGKTGDNLLQLLEARLDNTVYRLGIAPSRPAARQLVTHKHIMVNGVVVNVPSFELRPGDVIGLKESAQGNTGITSQIRGKNAKINWLDWSEAEFQGTFIALPERESVPENIKEQLIVELYSK